MSEWQPIETAPTDGRRVIVSDGEDIEMSQYTNWRWVASPLAWEGSDDRGGLKDTTFTPTHWMPLPKPPQR